MAPWRWRLPPSGAYVGAACSVTASRLARSGSVRSDRFFVEVALDRCEDKPHRPVPGHVSDAGHAGLAARCVERLPDDADRLALSLTVGCNDAVDELAGESVRRLPRL